MKRQYSASEKRKIVMELSRSDESQATFCKRKGIGSSTLWKWRKEYGSDIKEEFIELKSDNYYELKLGAVVLRIPSTESAIRVAELAQALAC